MPAIQKPTMYSLQELNALYNDKFSAENFRPSPTGLYDPVKHIMSIKGKRIRPLLLLISCDMFGGNVKEALNPAFAVEVFHNFTLVHDDIMDNADIRRGVPTVHKLYGSNAGILAGDVMLAYAYKYLVDVSPESIPALINVFNDTAIGIFEGQQMDMDFEKRTEVQEQEYLKMIEYKTSVLLGCCLQLGAILAKAGANDQQLAYEFGLKLGLSFQIKDDYLDTFGEADKVGKRIGGDIVQNKKTHLFVSAYSKANEQQKKQLNALLHEKDEEKKIAEVKALYQATGAKAYSLSKADELFNEALRSLQKISIDAEFKKPLADLAEKINSREF
jgi:geranylgeranyl diphosphate synthase type II